MEMDWYYKERERKIGPFTDAEFASLLEEGWIKADTPVWTETLGRWRPYGEIAQDRAGRGRDATQEELDVRPEDDGDVRDHSAKSEAPVRCSQCGNTFAPDDILHYNGQAICASCKPIFFQRLREGTRVPGEFTYGGFWIRGGAKLIDFVVIGIANIVFWLPATFFMRASGPARPIAWVLTAFEYALPVAYNTYFVGSRGATPGKMVCGLVIIRPDGERLGYGRAVGRYFAEILSGMLLLMGYIAAAFSSEKRALHDRICDTRVVKK